MHRRLLVITAFLFLLCCLRASLHADGSRHEYFDAHNHNYSGILPYYAYADLESFITDPADARKVDLAHRRRLWQYLAAFSYEGSRYSPGALATVQAYGKSPATLSEAQINGALERVLTTTPWTDFDSAYAFRGAPIYGFLETLYKGRFQDLNQTDAYINQQLCDASILELAATDTTYSEQFINFLGGWGPAPSSKLDNIRCFLKEPAALEAAGRFKAMGKPAPQIKSLLMTNTSELGAITKDGADWMQYGATGQCAASNPDLKVPHDEIRNALLGKDSSGVEIIQPGEERQFFDGVIGIDTAGPEFTCFTAADDKEEKGAGMDNYKLLVRAVYSASRERRGAGWHGKLLVHTHVGEGGVRYQFNGTTPESLFASFPAVQMDSATGVPVHIEQSAQNLKRLLKAVRELKAEIKDLDNFVVFRFGHVTHADRSDALEMKALHIEADINLESNIATRAYWTPALARPAHEPLTEQQQFEYNDLVAKVVHSGHSAELLSQHSLKFMLEAGVRTLLGSDGGGEEHSGIAQEYQLAEELIRYWQSHDEEFKRQAPHDLSFATFERNARAHIQDMQVDHALGTGTN
jgi:hypothetical protein